MKAIRCVYKPGLHNISVICHRYSITIQIYMSKRTAPTAVSYIQRTVRSRYVFGKSDGVLIALDGLHSWTCWWLRCVSSGSKHMCDG